MAVCTKCSSCHSEQECIFKCISLRSVQLRRDLKVHALFLIVCSANRSVPVGYIPWMKTMRLYVLIAVHFRHVLTANKGISTATPWPTRDRRIAQSNAKERRVQANTHRLPLAAVKSHCCQKGRGQKSDRATECGKHLKQKTVDKTSFFKFITGITARVLKVVSVAAVLWGATDC